MKVAAGFDAAGFDPGSGMIEQLSSRAYGQADLPF
jgi:hypothetical protein